MFILLLGTSRSMGVDFNVVQGVGYLLSQKDDLDGNRIRKALGIDADEFHSTYGSDGDSPISIVTQGAYEHLYHDPKGIDNYVLVCLKSTLVTLASYKIGMTPMCWPNGTYCMESKSIKGGARNEACIALQEDCRGFELQMQKAMSPALKLLVAGKPLDSWLFTYFN